MNFWHLHLQICARGCIIKQQHIKTHLKEDTELEDNNIPMDEQYSEEKGEKKEFPVKTLMIVMIALVLVAAVAVVGIVVVKPRMEISSAAKMAENGDAAAGYEALDRLSRMETDKKGREKARLSGQALEDALLRKQEIQEDVFATRETAELKFGKYDWIVLEERDGKALVITKNIISQLVYHGTLENVTWADCSLRAYLNGAFLNEFSAEEKARVVDTQNKNTNNPKYDVQNGKNTKDSVFLLSLEEANLYFKDNASRAAMFQHSYGWWWLRSAGMQENLAAIVTSDGSIAPAGSGVNYANRGVRPAMWITMP